MIIELVATRAWPGDKAAGAACTVTEGAIYSGANFSRRGLFLLPATKAAPPDVCPALLLIELAVSRPLYCTVTNPSGYPPM